MIAFNHALTGTAIGLSVGQPLLALPLALVSHFVCDALPHFWFADGNDVFKRRLGKYFLGLDAALCVGLVLLLAVVQPANWLLASVCAFLATSPDFFWIKHLIAMKKDEIYHPTGFLKWASDIQWFQRPIGAVVEVAWAGAMLVIITPFLT